MSPLPYPHRVSVLAPAMTLPPELAPLAILPAKVLAAIVHDHLVTHPVVAIGDFDDERLTDDDGRLLDADHPRADDVLDAFFRVHRREEVLWLDVSLDPRRPRLLVVRARRPGGDVESYRGATSPLSTQLGAALDAWLEARHLPPAGAPPPFDVADVLDVTRRLDAALTAARAGVIDEALLAPPPRLAVAFLRVMADMTDLDLGWSQRILALAPRHPVARLARGADPLAVIADAPMYARARLAARDGDAGVAAQLAPGDPAACLAYARQLARAGRHEEAYRWCDRATIAAPELEEAHVEAVLQLREVGRPGLAFGEALDRCPDAARPVALVHLDVGRLDEATQIAGDAATWDPDDPALRARAAARLAFHRGDPGGALALATAGCATPDDVAMLLEALIALGREDLARVAFHHHAEAGAVGDGKARLAGAKAAILGGDLDLAIDQIQIVQLRRPQARLEAEIDRLWRLAACVEPAAWDAAIARRLARGAATLARRAARDLADAGVDGPALRRALGERRAWTVDPGWLVELAGAIDGLGAAAATIDHRLAPPPSPTLTAADLLAQDWWTVLPRPREREAHAAAAVYALGVALARYLAAQSGAPTPIAGAYRRVATEALQLVRRARYHVEDAAERALLALLDRSAARLDAADAPLFDTWLLRVERALELDTEFGAYLPALVDGLPRVGAHLRGDERIGWELRLADDLAALPGQLDAARVLYARAARAIEGGAAWARWASVDGGHDAATVDVLANPLADAPADGVVDTIAAARRAGRALLDGGHAAAAVLALRYAALGFTTADDWHLLATAATHAGDAAIAAHAYERRLAAGAPADATTLLGLTTALAAAGRWADCEDAARRLLDVAGHDRHHRGEALHAMARALAGQAQFGDAARLAHEAHQLAPSPALAETLRACQARTAPSSQASPETTVERRAWDALAAGDLATVEELARAHDTWRVTRAALAASERRADRELVAPRALEAAQLVLQRTAGTTDLDACLCRLRALRIRENASLPIDPPPPLA